MDRGKQEANATTENWRTEDYRKKILKDIVDAILKCSVHDKKFSADDHIQSVKRFERHAHYSAKTKNEYIALMKEKVKSIRVESQKAFDAKNPLKNPSDSETTKGIIDMQEYVYQRLQNMKNKHYTLLIELYKKICTKLTNGASTLNSTEMDKVRQHKRKMEYIFSLFEMSKSDITPDIKDRATEAHGYIQMLIRTNDAAKEQRSPNVQPKEICFGPPSSRVHIKNNILSQEHQAGIQIGSSQRSNVNQSPSLKGPGNDMQQPTFLAQQATGPFGQSMKAPTTSVTRPVGKTYPAPQATSTFGQSINAPTISVTKPLGQTYPAPQATSTAPPISVTKSLRQSYPAPQETYTSGQSINVPTTSVIRPIGKTYPAAQATSTTSLISVTKPLGQTYPAPQETFRFGQTINVPTTSVIRPVGKTYPAPQATSKFGKTIKASPNSVTKPLGQTPDTVWKSVKIQRISATELLGSSINNQRTSPSPLIKDKSNVNQISEKPMLSSEEHSPAVQRLIKALTSISPETQREAFTEMEEEIRLNDELELPNFVIPEEWKISRNFDASAYENPIICDASKRPTVEENTHLLAEIKEINNRLFESEVIIYEKENSENEVGVDSESVLVKIIYKAVTINQNIVSQFTSDKKSLIKPLRLRIPASYPSSSLVFLDELPVKVSDDLRALFERAKGKLRCSVESMSKPWLVKDVARAWEGCVREAIIDYAKANGGGTFTSMYGGWNVC